MVREKFNKKSISQLKIYFMVKINEWMYKRSIFSIGNRYYMNTGTNKENK